MFDDLSRHSKSRYSLRMQCTAKSDVERTICALAADESSADFAVIRPNDFNVRLLVPWIVIDNRPTGGIGLPSPC